MKINREDYAELEVENELYNVQIMNKNNLRYITIESRCTGKTLCVFSSGTVELDYKNIGDIHTGTVKSVGENHDLEKAIRK